MAASSLPPTPPSSSRGSHSSRFSEEWPQTPSISAVGGPSRTNHRRRASSLDTRASSVFDDDDDDVEGAVISGVKLVRSTPTLLVSSKRLSGVPKDDLPDPGPPPSSPVPTPPGLSSKKRPAPLVFVHGEGEKERTNRNSFTPRSGTIPLPTLPPSPLLLPMPIGTPISTKFPLSPPHSPAPEYKSAIGEMWPMPPVSLPSTPNKRSSFVYPTPPRPILRRHSSTPASPITHSPSPPSSPKSFAPPSILVTAAENEPDEPTDDPPPLPPKDDVQPDEVVSVRENVQESPIPTLLPTLSSTPESTHDTPEIPSLPRQVDLKKTRTVKSMFNLRSRHKKDMSFVTAPEPTGATELDVKTGTGSIRKKRSFATLLSPKSVKFKVTKEAAPPVPKISFVHDSPLSADQLARARAVSVFDKSGSTHSFGTLLEEDKTTVVCFIRHFWCPLCQDYMQSIVEETFPEELERANIRLVVVGNGSWKMIAAYCRIFDFPYSLYSDPSLTLYHALGMTLKSNDMDPKESMPSYIKHPGVMHGTMTVVKRALKHKVPMLAPGGDIQQLGGEFIFKEGECTWARRMKTTTGHTPIREVLLAAGMGSSSSEEDREPVIDIAPSEDKEAGQVAHAPPKISNEEPTPRRRIAPWSTAEERADWGARREELVRSMKRKRNIIAPIIARSHQHKKPTPPNPPPSDSETVASSTARNSTLVCESEVCTVNFDNNDGWDIDEELLGVLEDAVRAMAFLERAGEDWYY